MKRRSLALLLIIAMIITGIPSYKTQIASAKSVSYEALTLDEAKAIYMDSSNSIETRISALLSQMTLEEKAAQMVQPEQNGDATPEVVKQKGIGSILSGGGSAPASGNSTKDWESRVNEFKQAAKESRLGIPLIYGVDAVHGNNNVSDTVVFPHNIGLGAANDEALTSQVGAAAAEEIRATGIQWTFAPTLGVVYSERWGRFYESFGENSDLVAKMGAAYVKGFQGSGATLFGTNKVAATAKHYIGEGQTTNGTNQGNVDLSEEAFDQLLVSDGILKPYEEALKAGARTVMISYNSVNGLKCHGNKHLIMDILKGEKTKDNPLGLLFTGFVVSDYNGIDQLSGSYKEKVADSVNAGIDMFMEPYDWQNFIDALVENVGDGSVSIDRVDDAVSRILRVKFEMGLFEEEVFSQAEQDLVKKIGSSEHREVAREAVRKSMVLLKNEVVGQTGKTAMELLSDAKSILVAGYKGNDIGAQCGGWTVSWQGGLDSDNGSGGKKVTTGTTIYEGIKEIAGKEKEISYNARGKIGEGYDVAVVVVGEKPYAESDGDRTAEGLTLPTEDVNVIKTAISSAKTTKTPIILVLTTGRPLAIANYVDDVDAIVEAWLPGTQGEGVADVLVGDTEFSGTLPVTWVWDPSYINIKYTDSTKVLFPYGTGLKKDGSSLLAGGQTQIPNNRPEAPETEPSEKIVTRDSGIDIDYYNGKVEAEDANPVTGTFSSYHVTTGNEIVGGSRLDYLEWSAQSWGNGKWLAYFRQAGTYDVTLRMNVSEAATTEFKFGVSTDVTGDGSTTEYIPTYVTNGLYEDVTLHGIEIPSSGLYGIKIMDGAETATGKVKLDYMQFTCTNPIGEKDTSMDVALGDPTDETPMESNGAVIASDAVSVYMTSTENAGDMSWYKYPTDMVNQLKQKESVDITAVDNQEITTVTVDTDKTYQELLGMGTSLEESSVNNISQLKNSIKQSFIEDLVNPQKGGMTLFRITIGTSDFTSKDFYTYYDAKELDATNAIYKEETKQYKPDWYNTTGNGFSIQKDMDYNIIKTVKMVQDAAKKFGVEDEVKFFASSWTPPGFMKEETTSSKSYADNDLLIKGGALKDSAIDDLAIYYTRYLEEYAKQGIPLYAITLQNEPMLEIDYPSCAMSGIQEGKLAVAIKSEVARSSILTKEQKEVKLWAFDHNPSDAYSYVSKILSVEGANEALDGIAFHDYSGSLTNMQKVLDELLNKNGVDSQTVSLTERSVWGTTGANSIITYLRNGAISYNSWVTMLDSNIGVHHWVGTPDPTMFARAAGSDNDYWAMPEFYITGQFSRFIRPGDVRVDSNMGSNNTVTNVVFMNPETKTLKAVIVNATKEKQNFKIVCNGTQIIGALPAENVGTYVWDMPQNIQEDMESGFLTTDYSKATDGVICSDIGEESPYITMKDSSDYAEYIVNVATAGAFDIKLQEQPSEDNQTIEVYQGDTLATTIRATKTWDSAKVLVQGQIYFERAGVQSIRIKMTPGLKLFQIALVNTKSIYEVPSKIAASEYIKMDGSASIENGSELGNMSAYNTVYYRIHVPEADSYNFTMSAATENTDNVGFWLKLYDTNYQQIGGDILAKGNGDNFSYLENEHAFGVSGSWTDYVTTSGEVNLPAGDYILGFTGGPSSMNVNWISIGAYADMSAVSVIEGAEDNTQIGLLVTGGVIADNTVASGNAICIVSGLPEGVTYKTEQIDGTNYKITLLGNRTKDFDSNQKVLVKLLVKQPSGNVLYSTNEFTIQAIKDAQVLTVPSQNLQVVPLGEDKTFLIQLSGGTFIEDKVAQLSLSGDAASYYSLKEVQYINATQIKLICSYNKKLYKTSVLEVTLPKAAYADANGGEALTASIYCMPEEGIPEDCIVVTNESPVTIDESMAYDNKGSMNEHVSAGNYTDYFLDVLESGTYIITYSFNTETADGTSYVNAWELNRGVASEYYSTNSYKQVSIPGLWTKASVKMRQTIELSKGKQTLELKAKMGGYNISSIEIAPLIILDTTNMKIMDRKIASFQSFNDAQNNYVMLGDNIEYTVDGTSFDYGINVAKSGEYEISANYAIESASGVECKVSKVVSGKETKLGSLSMPATTSWSTYKDTENMKIYLEKGRCTLRLTLAKDGANLKNFTVVFLEEKESSGEKDPEEETPNYAPVGSISDEIATTVEVSKPQLTVKKTKAVIGCKLSEKEVLEKAKKATKEKPLLLTVLLPLQEVMKQMEQKEIKTIVLNLEIPVSIQQAENILLQTLEIPKEIVEGSKENQKNLSVAVYDDNGKQNYVLRFNGKELKKSKIKFSALNVSLARKKIEQDTQVMDEIGRYLSETEKEEGRVLYFAQEGLFPSTASVTVDVSNITGMKQGKKAYVYAFDKKLQSLAKTEVVVDKNGRIKFKAKYGAKYVILPNQANDRVVTTLFDRVEISKRTTLAVGENQRIAVVLPIDAQGETSISYKSTDKSIAKVSKRGNIRVVKNGNVTIKVSVTIGKETHTYKTKISNTKK
ncbi:MAG: glycoside hydrolase family 3 N-terminal domain-containing protein [Velocimicrobium sp.]